MVTPAATAARMPEQCRCSASRYAPKGISRLIKICEPVSSPKCWDTQFFATVTIQVTPTPSAIPPIATHRNVPKASTSENVPVKAAATAKRMQTRPEASLSRDSPSRMCIKRLGIGTRAAIADTAIVSVGETIAASAKAMATGISGIIQLIKKPTPTTVNTTRPSASSKIVPLVAEQTLLGNAPAVQKEKRRQKQQEEDIPLQCNAEIGHGGDDRAKCDLNERMDAYCENHYPRSLAFLVRLLLYIATRWG